MPFLINAQILMAAILNLSILSILLRGDSSTHNVSGYHYGGVEHEYSYEITALNNTRSNTLSNKKS